MEAFLDFARGPLFRLTFLLMILGLARIAILDIWGAVEAYRKAGDKTIDWGGAVRKTVSWLIPIRGVLGGQPIYSVLSILFHVGLILVPIFLFAHVQLWKAGLGFGWFTLSKPIADFLTLLTIVCGLLLFIARVASRNRRRLSRWQDFIWPILLVVPFLTGYLTSNVHLSASAYLTLMLIHVLSGELILVLLPFSKIAHCVLMPMSQFVLMIAWRFPARVDEDVCATLNKKGEPV
jgi:nitrate reductase gamma subunit